MITASELAGTFAAHAIWCVSDGDTLIPMLAYTSENDEKQMNRLAHEDIAAAVEIGKSQLEKNEMDANDAALIYDGRIQLEEGKVDSIIIELRSYFSPSSKAIIAVPYTPKESGAFKVHRPKVLQWDDCEDFDFNQAMESFFNGVSGHVQGAKIWNDALDESI